MHQFRESATIALQAIWSNKLRSFLTVLGNIVAVTSIIAVVSLVQGLNATVKDAFVSRVGADAFTVTRFGITTSQEEFDKVQSNPKVTTDDAAAIRASAPDVSLVVVQARGSIDVHYHDQSLDSLQIQGYSKDYNLLPTTSLEKGRLITSGEFDRGTHVAILGGDASDTLFDTLDPIDKEIEIAGVHFRVIGIATRVGSIFGQSQDEYAVIPLEAFRHLFGSQTGVNLTVRPTDASIIDKAMDETTVAIRVERRLRPNQPNNFAVVTSDSFLQLYNQATAGIFAILIGVVSLSLVVGGIVIMNIMLMVVTERTREIGLRKALGARRRDILSQILTESVTLSTFGGVVGTSLGFLVAFGISKVSPLPAIVEAWSVMLGISITAIVGLFFGLYPAMQAAALDPIEALRRE